MISLHDTRLVQWLSGTPSRKWVIFAAGGFLTVSIGGYMIYSHYKKRRYSSDIPIDPDHDKSTWNNTPVSSKDGQKDPLAESQLLKEQGNKCFRASDYEKAVDCYTKAIEICPAEQRADLSILYQNRAAAFEKLNDDNSAYADCCKALEFNNRYVKALFRRANVLEKGARWREATHDYMKCCILQNFTVEETARKASKCMRSMSKQMAKQYLEKRRAENRPVPLSKTVVRATIRSFGCDPILSKLNEIIQQSDRIRGVIVENGPAGQISDYESIEQLVKEEKYDEAIEMCCRAIGASSNDPSIEKVKCLLLRSFFYNMTAKFDDVRADLREALRILDSFGETAPDDLDRWKCSAYLMFDFVEHLAGDLDQSMRYMEQALKLCPDNADVYSLRGQIRSLNNVEPDSAVEDFGKAAQLRPDFVHYKVQFLAAEIKKASEDQDPIKLSSIVERIKNLIDSHPDHVEANMFFAQAMLEMENVALAVKHLERASELDPNSADIIAQKAFIDMMNDQPEAAHETIERALSMDPYCLAALEIMAQYHSKRSDVPKMMECYDKALEVARSEAEAAHFFNMRETTLINMEMAEELLA